MRRHGKTIPIAAIPATAEAAGVLDASIEALMPGCAAECAPHTAKELAQTLALSPLICHGAWIAKQRSGPPRAPEVGVLDRSGSGMPGRLSC